MIQNHSGKLVAEFMGPRTWCWRRNCSVFLKLGPGPAQQFSEVIAAFGWLMEIFGRLRWCPEFVPYTVGVYITEAYWFTASI